MFTIEMKINGGEICRIYGRCVKPVSEGESEYVYEYYQPEQKLIKGKLEHTRSQGILILLSSIIEELIKKGAR